VSILKPKKVRKLLGRKGDDIVIYVTTIKSGVKTYFSFFRAYPGTFNQFSGSPETDTMVQNILDGEPFVVNAVPGYLIFASDDNLESFKIIDRKGVSINPKRYIIVLTNKRPKKLIKKFKKK
jgi:hypothetical protein